jgi:hypothetical protein
MIAGGLASKAGGGSFEDGAIAAGMVFLYNARGDIFAEIPPTKPCKASCSVVVNSLALFSPPCATSLTAAAVIPEMRMGLFRRGWCFCIILIKY